ncbi:MAG TPA: hypothetical protein ENF41_01900 [Candidatus Bathyarchaeota archaeon]|nr:hypothetical protein [Candidatus Bathyarchaeota archaeon]
MVGDAYLEALRNIYLLHARGIKPGLLRIIHLLDELDNPHLQYPSIVVGGSSGKGSTSSMIGSILREAGYKVGLFTKPHMLRYTERFQVGGREISQGELVKAYEEVWEAKESVESKGHYPTFFEFTVALAFQIFYKMGVELAVMEVGLGGRLDAVNIANTTLSVITNIHREHTHILGETLQEIALEKGGIIRKGKPVVSGAESGAEKVIKNIAYILSAPYHPIHDVKLLSFYPSPKGQEIELSLGESTWSFRLPLIGLHQIHNAKLALYAAKTFHSLPSHSIIRGLGKVYWPGRMEYLQKDGVPILLDCAKDPYSLALTLRSIPIYLDHNSVLTVVSISRDKDYKRMMSLLSKHSKYLFITRHRVMGRATDPKTLASFSTIDFKILPSVEDAISCALQYSKNFDNPLIFVTGSVFTVGEAIKYLRKEPSDPL